MKSSKKRIAIIGIGGIGGYIGSKLSSAYSESAEVEILFIQRGAHGKAIRENGLCYRTKKDNISKPTAIFETGNGAGIFDLILFTVKSKDLELAAQSLAANIGEHTILIPILNGINNAERLQTLYPKNNVLNACIYISASITSPGIVQQMGGSGMLYFGSEQLPIEQFRWIETLLKHADIKVELTAAIQTEVWKKFIFIASLATITGYTGATIGEVARNTQQKMQWICLMKELIALAKQVNIPLSDTIIDDYIERATVIPIETKTSMQIDIEAGKTPEFDVFVEYPVVLSKQLGIHCTVYNEYYARLKRKLEI